ncbi:Ankyrin-1 [Phytophthora ramorum]|uniref:Ankyrin-1 n=1 Tax=Phytophthora ramorum TaxID=164328 RepID=UPI0030B1E5E7|nr:Ankyrin-1 [Phytophthora ramorum]
MSKLTAFAAKQQRMEPLEGLSKTDVGDSSGTILSKVKVSSRKSEIGGEVGGYLNPLKGSSSCGGDVLASPTKPLKVLGNLRVSGDGQDLSTRKLVAIPTSSLKSTETEKTVNELETRNAIATASSPRTVSAQRDSSLKPLAPVDSDNQGKNDEADHFSTPGGRSQAEPKKMSSKPADDSRTSVNGGLAKDGETGKENVVTDKTSGDNKSDDEDFNFDDVDVDEKEALKPTAQPVEPREILAPPLEAGASTVDVEDLYDCPPDSNEDTHPQQQSGVQILPKMCLPRASDIELFHVVLTEDTDQLKLYLEEISPQEMLEIVDSTGRTLYHYAALSKHKPAQNVIFQHVSAYRDKQCELEIQALMRKKQLLNAWMNETQANGAGWVPPRLKELQREMTKQKCTDWAKICSSVDENGRSLFHYLATTTRPIPVEDDYEFCSALRSRPSILSSRDNSKKLALHYAVETGNLNQVKWHFQLGVKLNQADVALLLSFNVSRVMESLILRQLEAIDIQNYHLPTRTDASDGSCDPGVSTFVLAKLQRITDDSAGRLHQLPLHRAAMFGNIRAVELLLEEGADPNARDANQWTPLHYCADEATPNHLNIAQLLMESPKSVDINARSLKGRSPLHVAARSRKRKMLYNEDDFQSTEPSESENRVSFVAYLDDSKADLDLKDASGATPLLLACRGDHLGVVSFLLSAGCDPTATGETQQNALHFAATRGNPNMVSFLQSWDADSRLWMSSPDKQGHKPSDVAKNDSVRRMLVNLWTECFNGNVDQVRHLLLARSKQSSQDIRQIGSLSVKDTTAQTERTPLHLAIVGYSDALQLSSTRASSREEHLKQTKSLELKRTAPSRYLQVAILLLQVGADLGAGDKWGITPLMLAACLKDSIFMETLLDRVANEDDLLVADAQGNTALHYSYAFCQAQVSTLLEDQIDDADIENIQCKSPFEMTGYRDKIYPKGYRDFLRRQQDLRRRQRAK